MNYIVSFPRSGQHLIESIIRYLYSKLSKEFKYCEYYSCCNSLGKCNLSSNFQKNHDFWLNSNITYEPNKFHINMYDKYLVLYRKDKIKQLEAYYRYYINSLNVKRNYNYDDLISFINGNSQYYDNFVTKWINNDLDNILKIEYYDFTDDSDFYIKKIYYHFNIEKVKNECIFNLKNVQLTVDNGFRERESHNKIKINNNIDIELYNKIKNELKW
jgi:hypothetical protein